MIRARQLSLAHADSQPLNTFVQVKFADYEQRSAVIGKSSAPVYDQTFAMYV